MSWGRISGFLCGTRTVVASKNRAKILSCALRSLGNGIWPITLKTIRGGQNKDMLKFFYLASIVHNVGSETFKSPQRD